MSYPDSLVCPRCGFATFEQVRTCRVEFDVRVTEFGIEDAGPGTVQDAGERDESGIECGDCGESFDFDTDELLTRDAYNEQEADDA